MERAKIFLFNSIFSLISFTKPCSQLQLKTKTIVIYEQMFNHRYLRRAFSIFRLISVYLKSIIFLTKLIKFNREKNLWALECEFKTETMLIKKSLKNFMENFWEIFLTLRTRQSILSHRIIKVRQYCLIISKLHSWKIFKYIYIYIALHF